jgi:fumarate hydratase subunit alpha
MSLRAQRSNLNTLSGKLATVRYIAFDHVSKTIESLCVAACHELPPDVLQALERAAEKESDPRAAGILRQLIDNARIAGPGQIPLCQDTGLTVVFVEQGAEVALAPAGPGRETLIDAIQEGVAAGYETGYLRHSIVADPLHTRTNTGTNTPAVIHLAIVPGDRLKLTVMPKGGGCENRSQFRMFRPTADQQQVIDWVVRVVREAGADACPPFVVGVGIGGNFEYSGLLSKRALLRSLDESNADPFYAQLERDLLERVNALGLGPQGLGGDTTALAVLIETAPCHIASLPVAVNIECHSHRHKTAIL